MYVPKHFRVDDRATLAAFMRAHAFATLVTVVDGVPFATHIPVLVDGEGDALVLRAHVARANPQWRTLADQEALVIFSGPHAYVSPAWYAVTPSVPTWNYIAVHAVGRAHILADRDAAYDVVRRSTDVHEAGFAQPWRMAEQLTDAYVDAMLRGIVAFAIPVARLDGSYKLSQNRSDADRAGVAAALDASADTAARDVAALMRVPPS